MRKRARGFLVYTDHLILYATEAWKDDAILKWTDMSLVIASNREYIPLRLKHLVNNYEHISERVFDGVDSKILKGVPVRTACQVLMDLRILRMTIWLDKVLTY